MSDGAGDTEERRQYFDELSRSYGHKYERPETVFEHEKRDRLAAALSMAELAQGVRVLDLGVGSGELLRAVDGTVEEALGVDFSVEMLHSAKERAPDAEYVAGAAGSLPVAAGSFDIAFCLGVVGHVRNCSIEEVIADLGRIQDDGGQLLLSFANATSPFRQLRRVYTRARGTNSNYSCYHPKRVYSALSGAGYTIQAQRYLTFVPGLSDSGLELGLYRRGHRHLSEKETTGRLAMTWVVDARK